MIIGKYSGATIISDIMFGYNKERGGTKNAVFGYGYGQFCWLCLFTWLIPFTMIIFDNIVENEKLSKSNIFQNHLQKVYDFFM